MLAIPTPETRHKEDSHTKARRIHKPAQQREAEILAAATTVFANCGFQGADMQAVADHASVGKGTVYRYFASKEALFRAALHHNLEQLKVQMWQARNARHDPLEQLREAMRAYLQFFDDNPAVIELLVQERAELRFKAEQTYFFHYMLVNRSEWIDLFEAIAERYPLRGGLSFDDVFEACGDLVQGALMMSRSPQLRRPLCQRFDTLFDIYLNGVLQAR